MKIHLEINNLSPGDKIRFVYQELNRNNRLWHVRVTVDGYCVCRTWSRKGRCWMYELMDMYFLGLALNGEHLQIEKGATKWNLKVF